MKNRCFSFVVSFVLLFSMFSSYCFSEENTADVIEDQMIKCTATLEDSFYPGEVLIAIKKEYSAIDRQWTKADFPGIDIDHITSLIDYTKIDSAMLDASNFRQMLKVALNENSKEAVLSAIGEFEQFEFIRSASPNVQYTIEFDNTTAENPTVATANIAATLSTDSLPDDIEYKQADVDQIALGEAWKIKNDSSDIIIGVLDTGIDSTHPELQGRINETLSKNCTTELGPFDDEVGHGTHVAGIIGAISNNNEGTLGVCWAGAQMASIKVLKKGYNSNGDVVGTMDSQWAVAGVVHAMENNISILNMSFRIPGINTILEDTLSIYSGLAICAAGNLEKNAPESSRDNDDETDNYNTYPASYPFDNIISVASIDGLDRLSAFSHYGATKVDLAAPGEWVYSTMPNESYQYLYGTSMAAPYVTGVAALIMSLTDGALTPEQIKACILNGTDPVAALSGKCLTGGKLNAYRALRNALEMGQSTTVAGDFDGDGVDELAAFYGRNSFMALVQWENESGKFDIQGGSVVDKSDAFPIADFEGQVAAGDFDADGKDEIGVLFDFGEYLRFIIFKRQSDGSFYHYRVGDTGYFANKYVQHRVTSGDFDGDGRDEVGILYDNIANYTEMMILDYSTSNTFSYYTVGQTGSFAHGNMKGLISAGDYDGDGTDEMMGLYGYYQDTTAPYFRIWIFERTATGSFYHYESELYGTFRTSRIANTMVTGKFTSSSSRDVMAGIYRYDDTTARVFAFGRPSNSSWAYDELG